MPSKKFGWRWIWRGTLMKVIDGGSALVQLETGFRTTRTMLLSVVAKDGDSFWGVTSGDNDASRATMHAKQLFKPGDKLVVETFAFRNRPSVPEDETYCAAIWYESEWQKPEGGKSWAEQMEEAGHGHCGIPW